MRLSVLSAIALVAGSSFAAPAFATNFTIYDIELPYNEILTITSPLNNVQGYVGQQVLTTSVGTIDAWCIDLFHDNYVGGGQNLAYTTGPLALGTTATAAITSLINYGDALLAGTPTANFAADSAAIQLAIWKVEYGSTFTWTSGSPSTDASLGAMTAADLLASAGYGGNATALVSLIGTQGLVTADPVPEPASMALLGAGLFALGILRRKRSAASV
jgi:hypothetical protein